MNREVATVADEYAAEVSLRPLAAADVPELLRIHRTPEVEYWWDPPPADFPADEPDATRFTILVDGAVAGMVQYSEEPEPKYRHASIDIFIDPALRGRGVGVEAIGRVVDLLFDERGHHRIVIDPAAGNLAAVRCYHKVGFRPVGVMRAYERDADGRGWHDGLLMELLRDDRP